MSKGPKVNSLYLLLLSDLFPADLPPVKPIIFKYYGPSFVSILEYLRGLAVDGDFLVVIVPPDQIDHYKAIVLGYYDGEHYVFPHPNATTFSVFRFTHKSDQ